MSQQWTPWQYVKWYCRVVVAGFFRWAWGRVFGRQAVATVADRVVIPSPVSDAATVRRDRIAKMLWEWYDDSWNADPNPPPSRAPWLRAGSVWQVRAAAIIAEMERAA